MSTPTLRSLNSNPAKGEVRSGCWSLLSVTPGRHCVLSQVLTALPLILAPSPRLPPSGLLVQPWSEWTMVDSVFGLLRPALTGILISPSCSVVLLLCPQGKLSLSGETWAHLPPLLAPVRKPHPALSRAAGRGGPGAASARPRAKQPAWPFWARAPHRPSLGTSADGLGPSAASAFLCSVLVPAAVPVSGGMLPFLLLHPQSDHGRGAPEHLPFSPRL